ncbi:MAG: histidine phosphatase family protein, partial [Gammaproteobacteria bacterium]|nr:histidine phosphatase family protein [Gammaproteobacteria bacterium]
PADTPLSDRGKEQVLRLAQRLSTEGITRILASDLPRAAMTAQALSDETGVGIEFESLLQERNFGRLRGQRFIALEARHIDPFAENYEPEEGETWQEFDQRVTHAWVKIQSALPSDGILAVVTHGLVCAALLRNHLDAQAHVTDSGRLYPFRNASFTRIESSPPWRVQLLNCAEHLEALGDQTSIYGQV